MNPYPPYLLNLVKSLSRLPGIGEKSAMRMAMHMLDMPDEHLKNLAQNIGELRARIKLCSVCCNLTESQPCVICGDPGRDDSVVCVVETPGDLMAIEKSGCYRGRYHVLHGSLSPLDDVGPDKLKIKELLERLNNNAINEVILATNPTPEGDATASYLLDRIRGFDVTVSRIGFGIPVGGDLKFFDAVTLKSSLECRKNMHGLKNSTAANH